MKYPARLLCISGHDPSGGAGIQADIEACGAMGAHPLSVLSSLTVQDSAEVYAVQAVSLDWLAQQIERVCADCPPQAIKVGLLGSPEQAVLIARLIRGRGVPAVVDPVLRAGGGGVLARDETAQALRRELLPAATLITPNASEARALTGLADADAAGAALVADGCANVLVTGGDEAGETVINTWHRRDGAPQRFEWPREPVGFHGAGCTLASAIAARLAQGDALEQALVRAQRFVQGALAARLVIGSGRAIPNRWHGARQGRPRA